MRMRVNRIVNIEEDEGVESIVESVFVKAGQTNTTLVISGDVAVGTTVWLPKVPEGLILSYKIIISNTSNPVRIRSLDGTTVLEEVNGVTVDSGHKVYKLMGVGDNYFDDSEGGTTPVTAEPVEDTNVKDWEIINPANDDHLAFIDKLGLQVHADIQGVELQNAFNIVNDPEGGKWAVCYYGELTRLNDDFSVAETAPIAYESPGSGDGIGYCYDATITADKIIMSSYGHHCVRVYNRADGALLSTVGIPADKGPHNLGKLDNPFSSHILPNGNLMVSCYRGNNSSTRGYGSVSEWDISTPIATLVATRMTGASSTTPSAGSNQVHYPMRMIKDLTDPNLFWVVYFTRGFIAQIDITTWTNAKVWSAPPDTLTAYSYSLEQLDDGTLIVAPTGGDYLPGIDPDDGSLRKKYDTVRYRISNTNIRGVSYFGDGLLAVGDDKADGLIMMRLEDIEVPYDAPILESGWNINSGNLSPALDTNTWVLTVHPLQIEEDAVPIAILKDKL